VSVTIGRLQLTVTVSERRQAEEFYDEAAMSSDAAERAHRRHRSLQEVDAERDRLAADVYFRRGRSL
jgi:hypothetical protein